MWLSDKDTYVHGIEILQVWITGSGSKPLPVVLMVSRFGIKCIVLRWAKNRTPLCFGRGFVEKPPGGGGGFPGYVYQSDGIRTGNVILSQSAVSGERRFQFSSWGKGWGWGISNWNNKNNKIQPLPLPNPASSKYLFKDNSTFDNADNAPFISRKNARFTGRDVNVHMLSSFH